MDANTTTRYHKGPAPANAYRCQNLETLGSCLQYELTSGSSSLIPESIATQFLFPLDAFINISLQDQETLESLGLSLGNPQSLNIAEALCRSLGSKEKLKPQRIITKCIIDAVQNVDSFRYTERQVWGAAGEDGTRFKYVCVDSLQNRDRAANVKVKETKEGERFNSRPDGAGKHGISARLPTYDCGGSIHVKFSIKAEQIDVIYRHTPIHRNISARQANGQGHSPTSDLPALSDLSTETPPQTVKPGKRRSKKDQSGAFQDTSNVEISEHAKKPRKKTKTANSANTSNSINTNDALNTKLPKPGKQCTACVNCREQKRFCDEGKPSCTSCFAALETCEYVDPTPHKRSRTGCLNCRRRRRKCNEAKPSCSYCNKIDEECEYAETP